MIGLLGSTLVDKDSYGSMPFYDSEEEVFKETSYNLMHLMYVFRVCRLSFLSEERPAR